jgi:MFS family permease
MRRWRRTAFAIPMSQTDHPPPGRSDIRLLYAARGLRGFGDGFAVILLPAYLSAVGYGPIDIGIVAAASLLGSAILTLVIGWIAPRHDLRQLLLLAAGLMAATGLAFPASGHIVFVAVVAFIGTINPSAGDIGVFVPLEHAMLARGAPDRERTRVFARYSLIGALSAAAGALGAGIPEVLASAGIGEITAFRLMFYAYALLGLVAAVLYRRLPRRQVEEAHHAPRSDPRAPSSTGWPRCSASMPLRAASSCNRCSLCGCSSASTFHWPRPAAFSFGRAC